MVAQSLGPGYRQRSSFKELRMAKKKPKSLEFPPFPVLKWNEYFWEATVRLPAWAGYQDRTGPYGSKGGAKESDGLVRLTIDILSDEERSDPTPEQSAAYTHLLKNQKQIQKAILLEVFEKYPEYRASFIADYDLDETDNQLPVLKRYQQLKDLVGLSSIFIHTVEKDGTAYVGYEFGCAWEEEHGLGAMMHMDRVVEIGHADVGLLEWIAERDAKPPRQKKKKKNCSERTNQALNASGRSRGF